MTTLITAAKEAIPTPAPTSRFTDTLIRLCEKLDFVRIDRDDSWPSTVNVCLLINNPRMESVSSRTNIHDSRGSKTRWNLTVLN